uniref:Putative secreted protein n=1 Tax=Ixodes ricinus TaxID=34613 RepID=A0A6B0UVS7_IXORI
MAKSILNTSAVALFGSASCSVNASKEARCQARVRQFFPEVHGESTAGLTDWDVPVYATLDYSGTEDVFDVCLPFPGFGTRRRQKESKTEYVITSFCVSFVFLRSELLVVRYKESSRFQNIRSGRVGTTVRRNSPTIPLTRRYPGIFRKCLLLS